MKFNYHKTALLAMFYFIATTTGLCGVTDNPANNPQKSRSDDYRPLLEQGKTWKYSLVDWTTITYPTYQPGKPTEHLRETRLEGYETINGETYMKMNVYYDGSDTPAGNNPMYYIKEDTENRTVTFVPNENFGDNISWEYSHMQQDIFNYVGEGGFLYDFKSTADRHFYLFDTLSETIVTLADGEHKCYEGDESDNSKWRVIEGIGLTSDSYWRGCSILGPSWSGTLSLPDSYYDSYLYEVVNGDGQVIYSDESHRPGWWQSAVGISDVMTEAKVNVTTGGIAITGAPALEALLCDMQGRILARQNTGNGSLTLSTAGMTPGVYMLRLGSQSYKIAVR